MNSTARLIFTATAIAAGLSAGLVQTASAERGGPGRERPAFEMLDGDGDGNLTQAEIRAHAADRFAAVDGDGDGLLSPAELAAEGEARAARRSAERVAAMTARMVERLDQDGDGLLSTAELEDSRRGERMAALFDRADADGDGQVSRAEFDAAMERAGGRKGRHGHHHHRHQHGELGDDRPATE